MRPVLQWGFAGSAGAISALALPPHGYYPVLVFTFPLLVWLLDAARDRSESQGLTIRAGFAVGWWFGFGYFLLGLSWIGEAFLVDADRFAWMVPFVIVLMPSGLALFLGLACALAMPVWRPRSADRILVLAVALSLGDWLRGTVLTGFPWNSFGYAVSESLVLAQAASLVGLYGMSFVVVLVAASPAALSLASSQARMAVCLSAVAVLLAVTAFGALRLQGSHNHPSTDVMVRIVQPSIPQNEKWRPENREMIFGRLLDLSARPRTDAVEGAKNHLLVWPESALPFLLENNEYEISRIKEVLDEETSFLTGAIRYQRNEGQDKYHNSVFALDSAGSILDIYDKVRLVPFGEYLPFKEIIERLGLRKLVDAPGAFAPGDARKSIVIDGVPPFLPLICYEAIFPDFGGSQGSRPAWLLNVTNDAWFGTSSGPYQHFAQARFRSIEQGLPLVRAANTGISAVIDPFGRIVGKLSSFEIGVLDRRLPSDLGSTLYSKIGSLIYLIMIITSAISLGINYYNRDSRLN